MTDQIPPTYLTFSLSPKKKNQERLNAILEGLESWRPRTVRGIYYYLVGKNLIENDPRGANYDSLVNLVRDARKAGVIPWGWIEDSTRGIYEPRTWESVDDYRVNAPDDFYIPCWQGQPKYFEVWVEKSSLLNPLYDVCKKYRVALHATAGDDSWSSIFEATQRIQDRQTECNNESAVFHLADFDPQGWQMTNELRQRVYFFENYPEIIRVALNPEQAQDLPKNPKSWKAKRKQDHTGLKFIDSFGYGQECELEALEIPDLRAILDQTLSEYVDQGALSDALKKQQESREAIRELLNPD